MKKSDLIALLNTVPGNPEIKLWNGYVGDWMDIAKEVVPQDLIKMTKEYWLETCRWEDCRQLGDYTYQMPAAEVARLSASYNESNPWELNRYVTTEAISKQRYKVKKVYILSAKTRGVSSFDRIGNFSY